MICYLASPGNQLHADKARGLPVLLSYAPSLRHPWWSDWVPSYSRLLLDSGAFSEHNSGVKVDLGAYVEWAASFPRKDAWAGLDDISGNWRRSMENYKAGGFPTYHDTDPPELLDDLIPLARERDGWLGIGLKPPRTQRLDWLTRTMERIPDDLHVHGWALVAYREVEGFDSFDSTHWWREAMKLRQAMPWLTYGETLEIVVKKMTRILVPR